MLLLATLLTSAPALANAQFTPGVHFTWFLGQTDAPSAFGVQLPFRMAPDDNWSMAPTFGFDATWDVRLRGGGHRVAVLSRFGMANTDHADFGGHLVKHAEEAELGWAWSDNGANGIHLGGSFHFAAGFTVRYHTTYVPRLGLAKDKALSAGLGVPTAGRGYYMF